MKKYLVFIVSFAVLYAGLQLVSGALLTFFYTPDFTTASGAVSQEVAFGKGSSMPMIFLFIAATAAYILSNVLGKNAKGQHV
ncbi:hypothetical protein [Sporosarcina sp. HYO08]|uniref:hypothetical protein n=1 Tax=Sporosarcina sp. HYO08 TaxID=1759557 RepID=UPI000793E0D1|nr:hypothetical protein [Sporosarcina sp. HYO08]KXH80851.1 hypothetical protein AU377_08965 [Sporosarcina sp. HYO08]